MENPVGTYWNRRLKGVADALSSSNFDAFVAENAGEAKTIVERDILPALAPGSISWAGSMTFRDTGLYDSLKAREDLEILDTFDGSLSPGEKLELRRRALLVDLFITGTNAVTEAGELVNLDMIGNRVGAIAFGPKNVIILVGRNKVVRDLDQAVDRIKDYAAPANAMKLDKRTPCVKTARCEDCRSPDRICNTWTIIEKCYPKGRIKVVLVNEDMGL